MDRPSHDFRTGRYPEDLNVVSSHTKRTLNAPRPDHGTRGSVYRDVNLLLNHHDHTSCRRRHHTRPCVGYMTAREPLTAALAAGVIDEASRAQRGDVVITRSLTGPLSGSPASNYRRLLIVYVNWGISG